MKNAELGLIEAYSAYLGGSTIEKIKTSDANKEIIVSFSKCASEPIFKIKQNIKTVPERTLFEMRDTRRRYKTPAADRSQLINEAISKCIRGLKSSDVRTFYGLTDDECKKVKACVKAIKGGATTADLYNKFGINHAPAVRLLKAFEKTKGKEVKAGQENKEIIKVVV